jgi:coenzyme F420-reducing hydrogenase beta subunit
MTEAVTVLLREVVQVLAVHILVEVATKEGNRKECSARFFVGIFCTDFPHMDVTQKRISERFVVLIITNI